MSTCTLNDFNNCNQLKNITSLSGEILDDTGNITDLLKSAGRCEQLLQEFHRFDEGLSVAGKWQGGTVTGVCRGWGTSKVRISIGQISRDVDGPSETHFDLVAQ